MSEPKPEPPKAEAQEGAPATPADEGARVREQLGEGLRKFYDSVLDESIPAEWLTLVGGPPGGGE